MSSFASSGSVAIQLAELIRFLSCGCAKQSIHEDGDSFLAVQEGYEGEGDGPGEWGPPRQGRRFG